jgi:hypothetical protein
MNSNYLRPLGITEYVVRVFPLLISWRKNQIIWHFPGVSDILSVVWIIASQILVWCQFLNISKCVITVVDPLRNFDVWGIKRK